MSYKITVSGDVANLEITSDAYARFVEIRLKGYSTMLSDNYFDLMPNQTKTVTFKLPYGETQESVEKLISVRSLTDVPRKYTAARDKLTKLSIFLNPVNLANYIARTFDK